MILELIENKNESYTSLVDDYITSRGLINNFNAYYTETNNICGVAVNIVFNDSLLGVVVRSLVKKQYFIFENPSSLYPLIYNLHSTLDKDFCVITESIFDCESIKLADSKLPVVSLLSASLSYKKLHSLSVFKKLVFFVDNDNIGFNFFDKANEFFSKYYSDIEVYIVDYPFKYKDANSFLINDREHFFRVVNDLQC